jgi:hypothetical protein
VGGELPEEAGQYHLWSEFSSVLDLPSGGRADAAGEGAPTGVLGVDGNAVFLALGEFALHAIFDFAGVGLTRGHALDVHGTAGHLLAPVLHVYLVPAAVVRKVARLVLAVPDALHVHLPRRLVRALGITRG